MLRRLRRVLFTTVAATSLVAGVACLGLWGRARCASDHWEWRRSWFTAKSYNWRAWAVLGTTDGLHLLLTSGHRTVLGGGSVFDDDTAGSHFLIPYDGWRWDVDVPGPFWSFVYTPFARGKSASREYMPVALQARGFHLERSTMDRIEVGTEPDTAWTLGVPTWFPAIPLAVLPIAWEVGYRRRWRRGRRGHCLACGYDLRGSPGRCPECGAEAPIATSLTRP